MLEKELEIALAAVELACQACRQVQETIAENSLDKKDRSPVTIADFASQAMICHAIDQEFPEDPIVAEEDSSLLKEEGNALFLTKIMDILRSQEFTPSSEQICKWIDRGNGEFHPRRFWTLDPIDGTKGFLRGGQYAVALALIENGEISIGVLGCPNYRFDADDAHSRGVLFSAIRGEGAFVRPLADAKGKQNISVSPQTDSSMSRICESVESGHSAHSLSVKIAEKMGITHEPLRMDSQAKYAAVAGGEAEIYLRLPTRKDYREKIWDHAAGVLVVEEAGGRVTDIHGKKLDFTAGSELTYNRGVIVSNGHLHNRVLSTIQELQAASE